MRHKSNQNGFGFLMKMIAALLQAIRFQQVQTVWNGDASKSAKMRRFNSLKLWKFLPIIGSILPLVGDSIYQFRLRKL
ncbi:hypothetical protein D7I40_13075 [Citrobacter sp. MH181794]|nr:hypothetical protein D7I40_13075 [Citrobacter sp. MH181794]